MDARSISFHARLPGQGRARAIARLAGLARAMLGRAGPPPRHVRSRREDARPWLDVVPPLRDYPWRQS